MRMPNAVMWSLIEIILTVIQKPHQKNAPAMALVGLLRHNGLMRT